MTIRQLVAVISKIDGWLSSHEGYFLYKIARETKGNIVEIGSWKGKSTICLAEGLQGDGKIFAVDPHKGEYSGKNGIGKKAPTFKIFEKNLKAIGVLKKVKPLITTSENAAKKWKNSMSVLFIDGLHDYQHTHQDFSLWSPLLKKGGVVAFHDAFCGHDGPERVILEEVLFSNNWSDIGVTGSIIYARKQKQKNFFQKLNVFRHRVFIPLAIYLNKLEINAAFKFFIVHKVIKLLLLNKYTFHLLFHNYEEEI